MGRGRAAASHGEATRDRILDAAQRLFADQGYLGATTRQIAREAGIAEVTLFRHFPAKEILFEEVMKHFSSVPVVRGLRRELAGLPCQNALLLLATRFYDTLVTNKALILIMHAELQHSPANLGRIYRSFLDDLFAEFADYFVELQQEGKMCAFDPVLGARAFYGMIFSYFNQEEILLRHERGATGREQALGEFVRIFLEGCAKRPDS